MIMSFITYRGMVMTQYRVQISGGPKPFVVDVNGKAVLGAKVGPISFPYVSMSGPNGTRHEISGPGYAEIEVAGKTIYNVPLC
jgi:hypothetical protein